MKNDEISNFINALPFPEEAVEVESAKLAQDLEGLSFEALANLAGFGKEALLIGDTSDKLSMHGRASAEWLEQFEGSPLYQQAIQLCEQDLEQEKQHLQARMARRQEEPSWEQESNDRDMMRIQKQTLMLELHKSKAGQQAAVAQATQPSMPGPAGGDVAAPMDAAAAPVEAGAEDPAAAAAAGPPPEPEIPAEAPPEAAAAKMQEADIAKGTAMAAPDAASVSAVAAPKPPTPKKEKKLPAKKEEKVEASEKTSNFHPRITRFLQKHAFRLPSKITAELAGKKAIQQGVKLKSKLKPSIAIDSIKRHLAAQAG